MSGLQLEDLSVGQSAERAWTVSEAVIQAFAEVSGDANPVHLDEAYASTTQFKGRIAHGMLAASYISAVIGMQLPGPGSIYLSQSLKFRRPVKIGDGVTARVEIVAIDEAKAHVTLRTVCSVNGKAVVEGEAVVMVSRRGG
ncbi:MaoC family dehydratase [Phenylobacterium montanum]|uniref:MaoC family dehydratase n=1 Tax=Phenylobacterium montanum TaxID=2823693 RepID=A0A975FZA6_9CAUL|nr:MaoC family dehydratase [Caulobacter sp. S6]QUD87682.1 MaoC family dehydratase [Caulobacter sp. S6]